MRGRLDKCEQEVLVCRVAGRMWSQPFSWLIYTCSDAQCPWDSWQLRCQNSPHCDNSHLWVFSPGHKCPSCHHQSSEHKNCFSHLLANYPKLSTSTNFQQAEIVRITWHSITSTVIKQTSGHMSHLLFCYATLVLIKQQQQNSHIAWHVKHNVCFYSTSIKKLNYISDVRNMTYQV